MNEDVRLNEILHVMNFVDCRKGRGKGALKRGQRPPAGRGRGGGTGRTPASWTTRPPVDAPPEGADGEDEEEGEEEGEEPGEEQEEKKKKMSKR